MTKINKDNIKIESFLILPDIRSALNVGAIFRTADAVGVSKIFLTGVTPTPTDRFGRVQKDIAKSALGAETWIPFEYKKSLPVLIKQLRDDGFTIVALEQDKNAIDYRKFKIPKKVAIILGSEVEGLDKKTLKECDKIVHIPMHGKKESLNVSVAAGIVLFRMLKP